jgi:hypothetical protein
MVERSTDEAAMQDLPACRGRTALTTSRAKHRVWNLGGPAFGEALVRIGKASGPSLCAPMLGGANRQEVRGSDQAVLHKAKVCTLM